MMFKAINKVALNLVFAAGLLTATYPFYVEGINHFIDQQRIKSLQKDNHKEITALEKSMERKNAKISQSGLQPSIDPFSNSNIDSQNDNLASHLIGNISIPKINLHIPLFDTTNENTLAYGATVLQGTSFPVGGKSTHTVIAGHRGLASRILFTNLNFLKKGDVFVFTVLKKKLAYRVSKIQIVKPEDYQVLRIETGKDLATLVTCTPYMINTHRLLITGYRVPYTNVVSKELSRSQLKANIEQASILITILILLIVNIYLIYRKIILAKLAKKTFDLVFTRLNLDNEPVQNAEFQLFTQNKKKPLTRSGKYLIQNATTNGLVVFKNVPGGLYYLRENSANNGVIVGTKNLNQKKMTFYPKQKNKSNYYETNNELYIKY